MSSFGFVDLNHEELLAYLEEIKKTERESACQVLPRGRFYFKDGDLVYSGLVCHPKEMGGNATGVGAGHCNNCRLQGRKKASSRRGRKP